MATAAVIRDTLIVQGDLIVTGTPPALSRSQLTQEDNALYKVPLTDLRVWDALATNLPGTAAADDLALIGGTFGTNSPTIRTSDAKATTVTQRARFLVALPTEYVAGQTVLIRAHAGMITTISDTTATVDFECYKSDDESGISADLVTTSATTINSLTDADKDFVVTATSLEPGDTLDIRVTIAITDGATGTAVIGQVGAISLVLDVKG
jgi:hypothetical protein